MRSSSRSRPSWSDPQPSAIDGSTCSTWCWRSRGLILGTRFGRMASNIPRLAITSLTERLRVTGFTGVDVWDDWLRNDLDTESAVAHREALLLGQSYAIVWADRFGRPQVSVESAKQVACLRDSGTRWITAAVKRWETDTTTEAVLYLPDEIVRLRAQQTGASLHGFQVVDTLANPLGVVPVVRLLNSDRILDEGGETTPAAGTGR